MSYVRKIGLVLVFSLLAASCGGGDDAGTPERGQPAVNQELTVGAGDDQYVREGTSANLGVQPVNAGIAETLTYLSPTYEVRPLLAERWEFRAPNTWRFYLRPNVKFHDGQPLNAQAVKTTLFDRVAQQRGGGTIKAGPTSAVVVDDLTIDFTPTAPNYRVPEQVVHPSNVVYAPGSDAGNKPIGTGAFRFVEYQPKERLVVERNLDYWGAQAKLNRITYRFYPDANARRLALEAGDVDVALGISGPDVKGLRSRGFEVATSPVGSYEAMYANVRGGPPHDLLQDPAVRTAINLSIDRKQLVDNVLEGQATPDQTMIPPDALGRYKSKITGFQFDPARARTTLDNAGWRPGGDGIREKSGRKLTLKLISGFGGAEIHKPIPTYLQSQLRAVGIGIDIIERPDSASYQSLIDSGEGDLFLERGSQNDANVGFLPTLLFYTGGSGASAQYTKLFAPGPRFDEILTPAVTEPNADRTQSIVADAMHQIIDVDMVVIPLAGLFQIYGLKKSIQGFTPHPSFISLRWDGVSVGSGR
ncbi:MAG: ABC transporter substrate-binding protein [Actinomycetota bacterium]|nr:ABC transporter substrate-binding protein [Actinomycetota bacterium]